MSEKQEKLEENLTTIVQEQKYQTEILHTIKNWINFFGIMFILSLIFYVIVGFYISNILGQTFNNVDHTTNSSMRSIPSKYQITANTKFYNSSSADSFSKVLRSGTIVTSAGKTPSLECVDRGAKGSEYIGRICAVKVLWTGKEGWVSRRDFKPID